MSAEERGTTTLDVSVASTDRLFWTLAAVALVAAGLWKMIVPPHDDGILYFMLGIVCWRERSR